MTILTRIAPLAVLTTTIVFGPSACAENGDPLAIRLEDNSVLLENFWGLGIRVHKGDSGSISDATRAVSFTETTNHVWQRPVLSESPRWEKRTDERSDPNQFAVRCDGQGEVIVDVDGVRVVVLSPDTGSLSKSLELQGSSGVLVVLGERPVQQATSIVDAAASLSFAAVLWESGSVLPDAVKFQNVPHNVFAASASIPSGASKHFVMASSATKPREEVAALFTKMTRANEDSQKVFASLSPTQLNFRPSNGTHTPRWNAEHMMGRQLLFFSQIYHALDETIPVMNLNPKQMPKDYEPAKPDWDGREEARRMARVDAFCGRFAYLLKDVPLDQRAPGSRWTLRGLLQQMERHYDQHTTNTVDKFSLPDWPASGE